MRADTKRKITKSLWRNWGYLVLALVIYGWFIAGQHNALLLAIGSILVVIFALFFATAPCAAINKQLRDGEVDYCGNNGSGLLGACHLSRHKWENLKTITSRQQGAAAARHLVSKFCGQAAAFSALAGIGSFVVAAVALILSKQAAAK